MLRVLSPADHAIVCDGSRNNVEKTRMCVCVLFQNGVGVSANDAGNPGFGQLFALGQATPDLLADGAPPTRRFLAPQLRVCHLERRVRRASSRRLRVRWTVRAGSDGHRRSVGQRVRRPAGGGRPAGPAPLTPARGALVV